MAKSLDLHLHTLEKKCEGTSLGKAKPPHGEESHEGGQIHCQMTQLPI